MPAFEIVSEYKPQGDQPRAIQELSEGIARGDKAQVLLGVTGSGKTFTMANVIFGAQRPALVMAHNKTLAAQLYGEFKELFPKNAVEYFVSYYDYYQPEAYVPSTDTYIEKDSSINDQIDRMRHSATHSLMTRNDVIIVASVSCIYGLGTAEAYHELVVRANVGQTYPRERLLRDLVDIQYERNDLDFHRGTFRARGDVVEIFPAYEEERSIRITWFGDEIEQIQEIDPLRARVLANIEKVGIFPGSHYVSAPEVRAKAISGIREELRLRLSELKGGNKLLEAQRLEQRTMFDLEMIEQMGYCSGIENYSRWFSGRRPGDAPPCLIDYFPKDFLLFVDESHQTVPQVGAMYRGDQSRKTTLVDFGFRLPSALDNRPLKFEEWERLIGQAVFVSATPSNYELEKAQGIVVEQVIRPTGLMDPQVEVRPVRTQVDDLLEEIRKRAAVGERVLVTTLTKRMAEDLTEYYAEVGVKVRYLHSDVDTLERAEIIRDLRKGVFDVLVGINLLREGLDIPEVSLVAILDADKEGFLRSSVSLIQTIGRAARHVSGRVLMYAETQTDSMKQALSETDRRRAIQKAYNEEHHITPTSIKKNIHELMAISESDYVTVSLAAEGEDVYLSKDEMAKLLEEYTADMRKAAAEMEFEKAAELRDKILALKDMDLGLKPAIRGMLEKGKQRSTDPKKGYGRRRPQRHRK
ncbi:MAG TPA: excinuclease ABC subunit UvrB [Myxococcales bacterium]|jgi:excinuclease ABC subunit B